MGDLERLRSLRIVFFTVEWPGSVTSRMSVSELSDRRSESILNIREIS